MENYEVSINSLKILKVLKMIKTCRKKKLEIFGINLIKDLEIARFKGKKRNHRKEKD